MTRKIFVIVFFVLLLLPLVQTAVPVIPVKPLDENRAREKPPTLTQLVEPAAFVVQAQKWYGDHYGFRELLIRWKTQMDYLLFDISDKIHIGKDGWLFYRSVIDQEKPAVMSMSEAELNAVVNKFERLRDYLVERGATLVIITNQLKDKFYSEYLPDDVKGIDLNSRFDQFREKLKNLSGVIYIDTTPVLLELKKEHAIFHKTDFHWNDFAAAETGKVVVNTIAHHLGKPTLWHCSSEIKTAQFSGGQATFMPLFIPPSEDALFLVQNYPPVSGRESVPTKPPFESIVRMADESADVLPPALWVGDSFSDGIERGGSTNYFRAYYRVRRGGTAFKEVVDNMPSDTHIFVFQFIEVSLPGLQGWLEW